MKTSPIVKIWHDNKTKIINSNHIVYMETDRQISDYGKGIYIIMIETLRNRIELVYTEEEYGDNAEYMRDSIVDLLIETPDANIELREENDELKAELELALERLGEYTPF